MCPEMAYPSQIGASALCPALAARRSLGQPQLEDSGTGAEYLLVQVLRTTSRTGTST